ncbi:hypothetical protein M8J77_003521 [Diaphorina citri]|nr:hypothetical protein M8J77_003521 [Diaphorina citri]
MAPEKEEPVCECETRDNNLPMTGSTLNSSLPANHFLCPGPGKSDGNSMPMSTADPARSWQGTAEDSWAKIVPPRPQVFERGLHMDLKREHDKSYLTEYNVKKELITTAMAGDANQKITQDHLSQRCMSIHSYIKLLEDAIDRLDQDIGVLQNRKQRLRSAMFGVQMVQNINSECLHIRSLRMEDDHLGDPPYQQLIQESNMVKDLDKLMADTLARIQDQIRDNMAVKSNLQLDWSNKTQAFNIDSHNLSLNIKSSSILSRASSARIPENQSTPISWENYTRENLNEAEITLAKSADLIAYLDGPILSQYVKEVREQADKVNNALATKVCAIDRTRETLEHELQKVVNHLGETETVIADLKNIIQNLEKALKVAQTRLSNRQARLSVENCQDDVQAGLLEEVKCLTTQISSLMDQLRQAETTQNGLLYARNKLESEIQVKRKSITVDNDRCNAVRAQYPSLVTLSGH